MTSFCTSKIIILLILIQILTYDVHAASRTSNYGKKRVLSLSDVEIVKQKYPEDEAMRLLKSHEIVDTHSGRKVTVGDNGELKFHEKVALPPERAPDVLPDYMKVPEKAYAPGSGGSGMLSPEMMAMIQAKVAQDKSKSAQKAPQQPIQHVPKPVQSVPKQDPPVMHGPPVQPAPPPVHNSGLKYSAAQPVPQQDQQMHRPVQPDPYPVPNSGLRYSAAQPIASEKGGTKPVPHSPLNPIPLPIGVAAMDESISYSGSSSSLSYSPSYYGDDYLHMAQVAEKKGSSPWPMLFGMVLMIFIVFSGIGVYFLVVKVVLPKRKKNDTLRKSGEDRGPLPPTPDDKGKRRASRSSSKKDVRRGSRKPSTPGDIKSVKEKKKLDSDTEDEDLLGGKSSDDEENPYLDPMDLEENPYLDPAELNMPGSDYEVSQLRDAPAPPSKHYMDDDNTYDDPSTLHGEPDYIEFEG